MWQPLPTLLCWSFCSGWLQGSNPHRHPPLRFLEESEHCSTLHPPELKWSGFYKVRASSQFR